MQNAAVNAPSTRCVAASSRPPIIATLPNADKGWLSPATGWLDHQKKRLENPATFEEGYGNGLLMSGIDLVSGTLRLVEWGGAKGASYVKAFFTGGLSQQWEGDWQAICDFGLDAKKFASIASKFIGLDDKTRADWIIYLNALRKDDLGNPEAIQAMLGLSAKYGESFSLAAEVWAYATEEFTDLDDPQAGLACGMLAGEINQMFAPATKASKLSKAEGLKKLSQGIFAKTPEGGRVFARLATFIQKITTTKMCFVAGTLVHGATLTDDAVHHRPIETARAGEIVWARNEVTGEVAKKRIVATFVTHPEVLHHVGIDRDGDGAADETISGTAPHPFWSPDEGRWIPMAELKPGMRLHLYGNAKTPAYVLSNQRQNAPPGEWFTTYNFEVEDFHTYFVGESGVWVHNTGRGECERVFSVWHRFRERGDEIWDAYLRTSTRLPNATDDILKKTMKEVSGFYKAEKPGWSNIDLPQGRVQHTFDRHKEHWGFDAADNWNPANGDILMQKIQDHIADAVTDVVEGKFRGDPATFFVNTDTGLAVVRNAAGELTAAFQFSSKQKQYLLKKLSVN